jgi:hypothetical protein
LPLPAGATHEMAAIHQPAPRDVFSLEDA